MKRRYTEKYAAALAKLGTLPPDAPHGVLDIGSNSVRLVGYSGSARTPLPIYNERAFCRLGESVSATGRIEGAPRDLAMQTFQRFRAIAEQLGIEKLAAFATAAVRDASNRDEFIAEAETLLGHDIRVLSGQEEAGFSADGVMLGIPGADGLVADLGGGSLELARVSDNQVHEWASLPLGVLALARAGDHQPDKMRSIVEQALAGLDWLPQLADKPLYIVGGTWRALAKLHMEHHDYPLEVLHQYEMQTEDAGEFCDFIGQDNAAAQALLSGASGNRRAALPAASLVLKGLMAHIGPSHLVISANAVREGILYAELKAKYRALDPLLMAAEEMANRMCKSETYGHELAVWTDKLFRRVEADEPKKRQINRLREAACLISDMAWASHPSFRAATVSQTVLTAPFSGITHEERVFMARALAFRHETGIDSHPIAKPALSEMDDRLARSLGLSFRLAHSLSASLPGALPKSRLKAGRKKLKLTLSPELQNLNAPIIEKRLAVLAETLQLQPVLRFRDELSA